MHRTAANHGKNLSDPMRRKKICNIVRYLLLHIHFTPKQHATMQKSHSCINYSRVLPISELVSFPQYFLQFGNNLRIIGLLSIIVPNDIKDPIKRQLHTHVFDTVAPWIDHALHNTFLFR